MNAVLPSAGHLYLVVGDDGADPAGQLRGRGSVAVSLARHAPVPLLLVPGRAEAGVGAGGLAAALHAQPGLVHCRPGTTAWFDAGTAVGGLTAFSLPGVGGLLALPLFALPAILAGVPARPGLVHTALLGLAAFALYAVFGGLILYADWPLAAAGRAAERVRNRFTRGRRTPDAGWDKRLLTQRDMVRAVLGEKWWQAALLPAWPTGSPRTGCPCSPGCRPTCCSAAAITRTSHGGRDNDRMASFQRPHALREGKRVGRVTNVELFFDLVYVFAVTQLSELLVRHATGAGVFQAAILLAMVWQVWAYTTWTLNYLDPDRTPVRGMLALLMLGSLVLAAALPEAFQQHGLLVAVAYAAMQVGRSVFTLWELRGEQLQLVYRRLLPWTLVSGAVAVAGGLCGGHAREALWIVSIVIDVIGARAGFWVPWIGGSATTEWTINGGHFAERCQAFVLIALGESIVVVGAELRLDHPGVRDILAFGAAFLGAVGLWWVYFDRAADDSVRQIDESDDPGRLARSAFHWVHPLIIAGIILTAAADERVLDEPGARGNTPTAWLILGGTALFLAGHALFKGIIWHVVSWPRVAGAVVLLVLGALAPHAAVLTLGLCALAVIAAVAVADRLTYRG